MDASAKPSFWIVSWKGAYCRGRPPGSRNWCRTTGWPRSEDREAFTVPIIADQEQSKIPGASASSRRASARRASCAQVENAPDRGHGRRCQR